MQMHSALKDGVFLNLIQNISFALIQIIMVTADDLQLCTEVLTLLTHSVYE
jgi:hypothetical protein